MSPLQYKYGNLICMLVYSESTSLKYMIFVVLSNPSHNATVSVGIIAFNDVRTASYINDYINNRLNFN